MPKFWIVKSVEHIGYTYASRAEAMRAAEAGCASLTCNQRHVYVLECIAELKGADVPVPVQVKEFE